MNSAQTIQDTDSEASEAGDPYCARTVPTRSGKRPGGADDPVGHGHGVSWVVANASAAVKP